MQPDEAYSTLLVELDRREQDLIELRGRIEAFSELALLEEVFAQAVDTFDGDRERAASWMFAHILVLGRRPIEAIIAGDVEAVQYCLNIQRYGAPG